MSWLREKNSSSSMPLGLKWCDEGGKMVGLTVGFALISKPGHVDSFLSQVACEKVG